MNRADFDRLSRRAGDGKGVTYQVFDIGSYRTPSLRNAALPTPHFHDGSVKTLAEERRQR